MRFMKLGRLTLIAALALGGLAGGVSPALAQQGEIIIRTAPPAPRVEARGSYRSGYDWVQGYWRWDGRRHYWVAGHWERQRAGYVWQPARWDRRYDGWVFIPGRWVRNGGPTPPPPPVYNTPPREPDRYDRGPRPGYGRRYWERQGWVLLGEQQVAGRRRADRDTVYVGRDRGRFYKIMLVVEDSDIELHDLTVTFGNGTSWSANIRQYFREGARSRVIDLPKGGRALRQIDFAYSNLPGGGRASVQVWARR
jgi:hypothetical protein